MKIESILNELKFAIEFDEVNPVDENVYGEEEKCTSCGRRFANKLAWDTLEGGEGGNLCWNTCESQYAIVELEYDEIEFLIKFIEGNYE